MELNEWQKYILDGGKIYSDDGTELNASALLGDTPKVNVTNKQKQKPKLVSIRQLRALNIRRQI